MMRAIFKLHVVVLIVGLIGACDEFTHLTGTSGAATIVVTASTKGASLDATGYYVSVAGREGQAIRIQGTQAFSGLDPGDHVVELTGLAPNCQAAGGASRTLSVGAGETLHAEFAISCTFVRRAIAFSSNRDGAWDAYHRTPQNQNAEVYAMNADGTGLVRLTSNPGDDREPTWAPDGEAIAFATDSHGGGLGTLGPSGSGPRLLTGGDGGQPAWSPDGSMIAYMRDDGWFDFQVYVVDAAGTDAPMRVAAGLTPGWSPDGSMIVFNDDSEDSGIYAIAPDGTGLIELTPGSAGGWAGGWEPAWSPDGTRIAFTRFTDGNRDVWVMDADGTNQVNLTNHAGFDGSPEWSPDGSRIAFHTNRDGNLEVYVMNADGSGLANLTNHPAADGSPTWARLPL